MTKGLLVFFIVLVVIAIIHFISLRTMQIAEEKKKKIVKLYWYLYGVYFALVELLNAPTQEGFKIFGFLQFLFGITVCVLNYKGVFDKKKTT